MPSNLDLSGFRDAKDRAAFVAWLGRVQQRKRHLRRDAPPKLIAKMSREMLPNMLLRTCSIMFPWRVTEYPGYIALLHEITGLRNENVVSQYIKRRICPQPVADRVAGWLEAKAYEMLALAREMRAVPHFDRRAHMNRVRKSAPHK